MRKTFLIIIGVGAVIVFLVAHASSLYCVALAPVPPAVPSAPVDAPAAAVTADPLAVAADAAILSLQSFVPCHPKVPCQQDEVPLTRFRSHLSP